MKDGEEFRGSDAVDGGGPLRFSGEWHPQEDKGEDSHEGECFHWITSFAWQRTVGGIERPRAWAVLLH